MNRVISGLPHTLKADWISLGDKVQQRILSLDPVAMICVISFTILDDRFKEAGYVAAVNRCFCGDRRILCAYGNMATRDYFRGYHARSADEYEEFENCEPVDCQLDAACKAASELLPTPLAEEE